jgi:hypothetical protein
MDAFLDVPMADVLAEIPLEDAIKARFAGRPVRHRPIFAVLLAGESGMCPEHQVQ